MCACRCASACPATPRTPSPPIFGSHAEAKHVFAFDPDIDVFSDAETDWAFATRFQADRDLVIGSGFRVVPLDPSLGGARTGAKLGFDCTIPFGKANLFEFSVPTPPVAKKARRKNRSTKRWRPDRRAFWN